MEDKAQGSGRRLSIDGIGVALVSGSILDGDDEAAVLSVGAEVGRVRAIIRGRAFRFRDSRKIRFRRSLHSTPPPIRVRRVLAGGHGACQSGLS